MKGYDSFISYDNNIDAASFNHLKTVSLTNRQLYLNDNGITNLNNDAEGYLVVEIVLDDANRFIYNINSNEKSRYDDILLIHGRLLYVSLLLDSLVSYIIRVTDISQDNIIFQDNNGCLIVMPNTVKNRGLLSKLNEKINVYLRCEVKDTLYLSIVYVMALENDLSNDFKGVLRNLVNKKDQSQYNHFINNLEDVFKLELPKYNNSCNICGRESKTNICYNCNRYRKLGLLSGDYLVRVVCDENYGFDVYYEPLNQGYKITNINSIDKFNEILSKYEECDTIEFIKINDSDNFLEYAEDNTNENISFSYKYLLNTMPEHSLEGLLTLEDLSKISKGSNRIGLVNLSMDNKTSLYSNDFNNHGDKGLDLSRIQEINQSIDLFFSGINKIITDKYYVYESVEAFKEDIYDTITLTRSDGTFNVYKSKEKVETKKVPTIYTNHITNSHIIAIGPYDDIINFTSDFEKKLREWTSDNITISGSINILKPGYPINLAISKGIHDIKLVKKCGGNKIKIMNEILSWNTIDKIVGFNELLDYSNRLDEYLKLNYISRRLLSSLLQLHDMYFNYKTPKNIEELDRQELARQTKKGYVPLYKYKLIPIDNYEVFRDLDENGIRYMPWARFPLLFTNLKSIRGKQ